MSSLVHRLKTDHPSITFFQTDEFSWSPQTKTVSYNPAGAHASAQLLHELSHALLNHTEYRRDIELIAMETAAWEHAHQLAATYRHKLDEDVIQDHLDTYREWLHTRSTCPECKATGFQTGPAIYECPACTAQWRVNEARLCNLRRYTIK